MTISHETLHRKTISQEEKVILLITIQLIEWYLIRRHISDHCKSFHHCSPRHHCNPRPHHCNTSGKGRCRKKKKNKWWNFHHTGGGSLIFHHFPSFQQFFFLASKWPNSSRNAKKKFSIFGDPQLIFCLLTCHLCWNIKYWVSICLEKNTFYKSCSKYGPDAENNYFDGGGGSQTLNDGNSIIFFSFIFCTLPKYPGERVAGRGCPLSADQQQDDTSNI